ncbi:MAG: YIP1 family protein [Silanimonas sp.]
MQLVDIFLDPAKVFAAEKEKPTFLVPTAVFIVLSAAMILAYHLRVDPAWFADFQLSVAGAEMTDAEKAQAKQFMPGARMAGYIGAAFTAVVIPIMFAISALYYFLAGKIAGAGLSFKHGLSLASWSALPIALTTIVAIVGALTMAPQTAQYSLMLTHVDPLLVQLPIDHALSSLAKSFNLLSFWAIGLAALGWKVFTRSGWGAAIFVAALPSVLIYGIWLLIALL